MRRLLAAGAVLLWTAAALLAARAILRLTAPPPSLSLKPRRPLARARRADKDEVAIVQRNLFCPRCKPGSRVDAGSRGPLRVQLLATAIAPQFSFAVLRDAKTQAVGAFALDARVGDATLVAIEDAQITLAVSGRLERVGFEAPERAPPPAADAGVRRLSDTRYEVSRDLVAALTGDPAALAGMGRVAPAPGGLRVLWLRPGSALARLGLESGDLVHAINGFELATPDQWLLAYSRLAGARHLSVALERRGVARTIDYTIR